MNKLLQMSTYGLKNLENTITINFANSTIEKGIKKLNNIKGIFGYNGAGKSALMASADFYKNLALVPNFLLQSDVIEQLSKLINFRKKEFFVSMIFDLEGKTIIKHTIKLNMNAGLASDYIISEEDISVATGRTLNDKYKSIVRKKGETVTFDKDLAPTEYAEALKGTDFNYNSLVITIIRKLLRQRKTDDCKEASPLEKTIINLALCINKISVYLSVSDRHKYYIFNKESMESLISYAEEAKKQGEDNWIETYTDEETVNINEYDKYQEENKRLEKFVQIFKPSLKKIDLIPLVDHEVYHIRRVFVYEDYAVEYEFESSGIKQLVKLFAYLLRSAKGGITFIDEIDTNINTVYFEKLLSFYRNYGEGQLIFTTHNIESMNCLKKQGKAIVVLGEGNKLDTWVGVGNKSPITDYIDGNFPNSPMNVEDFDFINVFLGGNDD